MRIGETSASEPLMGRRNELNVVKTGGFQDARMSTGGTCRLEVKGKAQVEAPQEREYQSVDTHRFHCPAISSS